MTAPLTRSPQQLRRFVGVGIGVLILLMLLGFWRFRQTARELSQDAKRLKSIAADPQR